MRAILALVMRGRSHAIGAATLLGMLSLAQFAGTMSFAGLAPLVQVLASTLSGAVIALVALRHGLREAAWVLLGAAVLLALFSVSILGGVIPAVFFVLALWLPLAGLGVKVRATQHLSAALPLIAGIGITWVVVIYLILDDPSRWGQGLVDRAMQAMSATSGGMDTNATREVFTAAMARVAGMVGAAQAVAMLTSLCMARAAQALLYNPGGFRAEFHDLKFGRPVAVITLIAVTVGLLTSGRIAGLGDDVSLVLMALFIVQGLAIVHTWVAHRQRRIGWLWALYISIFILPFISMALAMIGWIDNWLDFRGKIKASPGAPSSRP